ncbi:MAG: hypothetical protein WC536_01340 [Patescibacteria group bacterium]
MREIRSVKKLINVFAWINWFLSAICLVIFVAVLIFSFFKVDADWENKIYALLIILIVMLFPAIFFFLNGVILKSKNNCDDDENKKIGDF